MRGLVGLFAKKLVLTIAILAVVGASVELDLDARIAMMLVGLFLGLHGVGLYRLAETETGIRRLQKSVGSFLVAFAFFMIVVMAIMMARGEELTTLGKKEPADLPPVILISLDTLRADHLSAYGYERETSPHLEEFAKEAVVFERFYSTGGGTLPAHMSLMTSLTPVTHGIVASREADNVLHLARETLAETLRAAGYWTGAFTDRGWLRSKFGIHQGFDVFDEEGGRFATVLPKAKRWVARHHEAPFFLFAHTYDIHSQSDKLPYECPKPFVDHFTAGMNVDFDGCRGELCASRMLLDVDMRLKKGALAPEDAFSPEELEFMLALYDGCIRYADDQVAKFFSYLRELGVYDKSLVIVLSDHGEEFLDHGRLVHARGGYNEVARIPLLIKLPGGRFGGLRISKLANLVDVLPTILDVLGLERLPQAQGKSLMPLIAEGEEARQSLHMFNVLATERWKLFKVTRELYDLEADPEEQVNLWEERPGVVRELLAGLDATLRTEHQARRDFERSLTVRKGDVELSEEEIEELRALGYLN